MKKSILLLFLLCNMVCLAQKKYYRMEGKIYDEEKFNYQKKGMIDSGNVMVELTDNATRNDSTIYNVKLTMLDPFERHRKKIGTYFNLENFKNENGLNHAKSYLIGKPSLINFWFTRCAPCIKEMPALNTIQSELKDKVNFIAINFEDAQMVKEFLENTLSTFNTLSMP